MTADYMASKAKIDRATLYRWEAFEDDPIEGVDERRLRDLVIWMRRHDRLHDPVDPDVPTPDLDHAPEV